MSLDTISVLTSNLDTTETQKKIASQKTSGRLCNHRIAMIIA